MKLNQKILDLKVIKIETHFSENERRQYAGWGNEFFIVPLEMVINGERDLWHGCPNLVSYELLQCLDEIIAAGNFPYNSTVGQLFCDKNNLGKYEEHTFLSAMVYCTQQYKSVIDHEKEAIKFNNEMQGKGFIKATDELLKEVVNTKRKFLIVVNTTNILGGEGKSTKQDKLLLKDWGEQGLHWMSARSKRKGFRAKIGQYIKEAV